MLDQRFVSVWMTMEKSDKYTASDMPMWQGGTDGKAARAVRDKTCL
jgi:hypothetical protein